MKTNLVNFRHQISPTNNICTKITKPERKTKIASFYSTSPSGILPLEHGYHRLECLSPDSGAVECDLNHLQN